MYMARRSSILASDADRERVAERLRQAATEGRILAEELEERVARALRARTYGELDLLVADLPRPASPVRQRSTTLSLARSHPLLAVVLLVTVTLTIFIAAAVLAFSGAGFLLVILALTRFGPWCRGCGPRGRYGGPGYGASRSGASRYGGSQGGRSPHWVR
jgi:hypothetical protein